MKKKNALVIVPVLYAAIALVLAARSAHASTGSLSEELQSLSLPANEAPVQLSQEKLYAVQTRFVPLRHRSELSIGGGEDFTGDSFLSTRDLNLGYRFHLSDRWSLAAAGSAVFNTLTGSGQRLLDSDGRLPDSAYAKWRADLTATYNVFYGKFRVSMDQVFYFDQYASLGAGAVGEPSGTQPAAVADLGFAFWIGRSGVVRLGLKDYYYKETRTLSASMGNNLYGHLEVGYLLGGGR
jgi:outer membrane beta-barrel protein